MGYLVGTVKLAPSIGVRSKIYRGTRGNGKGILSKVENPYLDNNKTSHDQYSNNRKHTMEDTKMI